MLIAFQAVAPLIGAVIGAGAVLLAIILQNRTGDRRRREDYVRSVWIEPLANLREVINSASDLLTDFDASMRYLEAGFTTGIAVPEESSMNFARRI